MGRLNGGDKAYTYPTIVSDWAMLAGSQTRPVHDLWVIVWMPVIINLF